MEGCLDEVSRTPNEALVDLRKTYAKRPGPELARMIRQLEAEIAKREAKSFRQPDRC